VSEESPIITVTFQTVLNRNLIHVTDALNEGTLYRAFHCLRTTIGLLKEQHSKLLFENDLTHIGRELAKASKISRVDLYQTRRAKNSRTRRVLKENLFNLFLKLMEILHKHGYLEKKRHRVERSDFKELENESVEA